MMTTSTDQSLQEMAEEIFTLSIMASRKRLVSRGQGDSAELSETQFLTLDTLVRQNTLTVGELQRSIGVLPAQMSRIIRSLESSFDKPLIRCELNQSDKRKIDVAVTPAGRKVFEEFRNIRLGSTVHILASLPPQDRQEFIRICREIKQLYHIAPTGESPA
jgi:DNA-binding MarR family transcriptional regulator